MTNLTTDQEAVFSVTAANDDNVGRPAMFTASLGGASGAYIAKVGDNQLHFVPTAPGTYTVTISGHDSNNVPLPTTTVDFTVTAPPPPPGSVATHFVISDITVKNKDITTPTSGSDTVIGSV